MSGTIARKADPSAALIVYGRLDGVELPQAAWFRKEDSRTVETAAAALKLSTLKVASPEEQALATGISEGAVKSSGRVLLGSVATDIYQRLEERGRAVASTATADTKGVDQHQPPIAKDAWEQVKPGAVVLAAYWDKKNQPAGWWPAVVVKVCDNGFVLRWRDTPDIPLGKLKRKFAILHAEFLATLK